MAIIKFKDVWEMYRIKFIIDGRVSWENYWALKGINLEVEKGESLGIIGENGAGKSTLLKLIAGILRPDRGEINVSGNVSGLLELGAGFQPELTGKDNVYFNARLFGFTAAQIEQRYAAIVDFADIGKFIHAPIKCYSQGMFVRLAFAIAVHITPDVFVIDDTLAVGDEYFQRKCIKKIFEIKEQGKIIIFVTHDMNMLRRICNRSIFIKEGRIIKDAPTDQVIPLYTQTIGSRDGLAILEKKPLNLVFNNGRLFINWQDMLITPASGAHTVFYIANKRYNSFQADWETRRDGENKIIATGKLFQLGLTQIWELEIVNDYEIRWDIYLESEEALEFQEGNINIMLSNNYGRWFTTTERGDFPFIDDKIKNWRLLLDSNLSIKCIGVEPINATENQIPTLAFEQLDAIPQFYAQVLNSDYITNCRILQYKIFDLNDYLDKQSARTIYFSGKIAINIQDTYNYLKNLEDESVLSNKQTQLIFNNGRGIISYEGTQLTKSNHMLTSICVNKKWYSSPLARWKVQKDKDGHLLVVGRWAGLPIAQTWKLKLKDNYRIVWEIALFVESEVNIEQQNVSLAFSEAYKSWLTTYYGKGDFPENFLMSEMVMLQRYIPNGLIGLQSENNKFPRIFLKFSQELNNHALIYNSSIYDKTRTLRIHKVQREVDIRLSPGEYPCFLIEVAIDKEKNSRLIEDPSTTIENGRLRFAFENGCGRIFWDGIELTKGLCLYTSLRSQGRWHDSAWSALWELEENDKNTIKAEGKWFYLPIAQTWEIRLLDERTIEFKARMKITERTEIERMQTNIMLLERYTQWLANKEKGDLPQFKNDINDDWHWIWSGECNGGYIGVSGAAREEKRCLPPVLLSSRDGNSQCRLNVINSDVYHQGRVLQFFNPCRNTFMPGEYIYYQGTIKIGKL